MKNRIWVVLIISFLSSILFGCNAEKEIEAPAISQIRNICNLATVECYYHNVAKAEKKAESGFTHLGEKDRKFWIEYTGIVRLGVDMKKIDMTMEGDRVTLTIPKAKILGVSVDKDEEMDYISSNDGLNKNKITAEDQIKAMENAEKEMIETAKNNESLLLLAQNRAILLIENYINQLGNAVGKEYEISWKYLGTE